MKTTIPYLLFYLLILGIMALVVYSIIYNMGSLICQEYEVKPIRYEPAGLFGGTLIKIETTVGNEDGYSKVCTKYGELNFFDITGNIEFLVSNVK